MLHWQTLTLVGAVPGAGAGVVAGAVGVATTEHGPIDFEASIILRIVIDN